MSISPNKLQFEQAAAELSISPAMIEKDWHVVQVLALISKQQFPDFLIVFSGGTALSKAYGLIQRFSEDIDFRVIYGENAPSRKKMSAFKTEFIKSLTKAEFQLSAPKARDNNRYFTLDIAYNTLFDLHDALRPHIKLEIKVSKSQLPIQEMPVGSFLAKLANQPPEVKCIACMDPVETAADKLSALAWRIPNRAIPNQSNDPTLVRHIHDLAVLEKLATEDGRFIQLVAKSMQIDNDTVVKNKSIYGLSNTEKLDNMLTILEYSSEYRWEYDQFVKSVSYAPAGAEPDFDKALDALKRLVHITRATY